MDAFKINIGSIPENKIINDRCHFGNNLPHPKYLLMFIVEFLKTPSGDKLSLTNIADHTQLGSPARLATKRIIIQSSS